MYSLINSSVMNIHRTYSSGIRGTGNGGGLLLLTMLKLSVKTESRRSIRYLQ